MKTVLLVIHDDFGQEARYQAAMALVHALDGHLACLDVSGDPVVVGDDFGAPAKLLAGECVREATNRSALEKRLAAESLSWNWIDPAGDPANRIADAAADADIIVINRRLDSYPIPGMRNIAAETLLKIGKPVLAIPEMCHGVALHGHAMIAWDGSEEIIAALREAVPLLKGAQQVTIFEVEDGSIVQPGEEAALYLGRHGIACTVRPKRPALQGAAREILKQAELLKPDYLVMGAFGDGRYHQAVGGGVTRTMLTECPISLFLAH